MGKSAQAPDYTSAANAQAGASKDITNMQTYANRPTINTPFGGQSWTTKAVKDPSTGQMVTQWVQNNTLTPSAQSALTDQQNILAGKSDLALSQLGAMQNQFSGQPDWNSFQSLQGSPGVPDYQSAPGQANYGQASGTANYSNFDPNSFQTSLDTSGNQTVDPSQRYYQQAGDAVYNQFQQRMNPQFANANDALRTQLYNQGLKEGDAAYDKAWNSQQLQQNDARQTAMNNATQMAGSEAARMQGMDLSTNQNQFNQELAGGNFANSGANAAMGAVGFNNSNATNTWNQANTNLNTNNANATNNWNQSLADTNLNNANTSMAFGQGQSAAQMNNTLRQQQIAEMMQQRGFSLNEMNAILNGQQVNMPNMPSFSSATKSDTPQLLQAAQSQYSAAQDAANATNAIVGQAAGAASMFMSDRRLKSGIRKIGKWRGHNLYVYEIFGRTQVGVMSDEVRHIPGAVSQLHGYDVVNYDGL